MFSRSITTLLLLAPLFLSEADAAVISLDMLDPTGTGNTAGEAFEATGMYTESGVTFAVSAATTLGSMTGSYSANTSSAGINSDGVTGATDAASELDAGESLTLTVTFSDLNLRFTSIDFDLVGGSGGGDAAFVSVAGTGPVTLQTGAADFNGSADVWAPAGGLTLLSGQTIEISAEDNVELISLSFETSPVPEPAHTALAVFGVASLIAYRRRQQASR